MRPFEFLPHEYLLPDETQPHFPSCENYEIRAPPNFWLSLFHQNAWAPRGSILHPIHVLEISISIANLDDVAPL